MKPAEPPIGREGRPARHCRELIREGPTIEEMVPALSLFAGKLSRSLATALSPFSGGRVPVVSAGMPIDGNLASVDAEIETLASHARLVAGYEGLPLLVTFGAAAVLSLVDRAFGGTGEPPEPLPETFPLSAELLVARLEEAVAQGVAGALGGMDAMPVRPERRDTSLRQLAPFAPSDDLLQLAFSVAEPGRAEWSFALAFPLATLALMLGDARPAGPRAAAGPGSPAAEPFASVPLTVSAVLVDMAIGFRRLADLRPGDVLPVAVARQVPLRIGERTVASGTLGEVDDRVAVQVSQSF